MDGVNRELPGAKRDEQIPTRRLVERIQVEGAIAFVAKDFDQRRTALFLGRLELAIRHAQQLHLQGLDQEVLRIPTIRTRQRPIVTPLARRPARVYLTHPDQGYRILTSTFRPGHAARKASA